MPTAQRNVRVVVAGHVAHRVAGLAHAAEAVVDILRHPESPPNLRISRNVHQGPVDLFQASSIPMTRAGLFVLRHARRSGSIRSWSSCVTPPRRKSRRSCPIQTQALRNGGPCPREASSEGTTTTRCANWDGLRVDQRLYEFREPRRRDGCTNRNAGNKHAHTQAAGIEVDLIPLLIGRDEDHCHASREDAQNQPVGNPPRPTSPPTYGRQSSEQAPRYPPPHGMILYATRTHIAIIRHCIWCATHPPPPVSSSLPTQTSGTAVSRP